MNQEKILNVLNRILEAELAGVIRYTHYSLMVFGHDRMPLVAWLRSQSAESLTHAEQAGEYITSLGGEPSLKVGKLLAGHKTDIYDILGESLEHEKSALALYKELSEVAEDHISIEEYARGMVMAEQNHVYEVEKMIRGARR